MDGQVVGKTMEENETTQSKCARVRESWGMFLFESRWKKHSPRGNITSNPVWRCKPEKTDDLRLKKKSTKKEMINRVERGRSDNENQGRETVIGNGTQEN